MYIDVYIYIIIHLEYTHYIYMSCKYVMLQTYYFIYIYKYIYITLIIYIINHIFLIFTDIIIQHVVFT